MPAPTKRIIIARGIPGTITLLQKGVRIHAPAGISIRQFMTDCIGLTPDYAESRVKAIFHNNSPVDSIDEIKIQDGDTVSLSGALPGICGIAMSRDTVIKGLRGDISAKPAECIKKGNAVVMVKLFNLVASEAGANLLSKGVVARAADILDALRGNSPSGLSPQDGDVLLSI